MYTFGGFPVENTEPEIIEKTYSIKLDDVHGEKIPIVFPDMNPSSCSCDKCTPALTIENFQLVTMSGDTDTDVKICSICRSNLTDNCIDHSQSDSSSESCKIIKGITCSHHYHHCCIVRWLKTKSVCPICNAEWKFYGIDYNKITICHEDKVYEFDATPSEDFLSTDKPN